MGSPIMRRRHSRRPGGRRNRWLQFVLVGLLTLLVTTGAIVTVSGGVLLAGYYYYAHELPTPEEFEELTLTSFETTKIYDRTGEHLLYEVQDPTAGDRTIIPMDDIPLHMRNATVALEDKTFYSNPGGINIEGIFRAAWNNLRGESIQGGSSIVAQLVRNVAMEPEERFSVSYERKIKEAILSLELTRRYPGRAGRDRLLEWYLNTVFYGNHAYGVEAAAKAYFGKQAKDLTLAECAMLASIPQYPAQNPIDNPDEAKRRQGIVLDAMTAQGYITQEEAEEAKQAELGKPITAEHLQITAPHFVMHLLNTMVERYGKEAVYGGGLRVISSLDLELQQQAEEIVRKHVNNWSRGYNANNAATVIIRPSTGEILAMVGSVDYFDESIDGECNMAVEPRQPGSSFKPYTYVAAFEQGYNPSTMVEDVTTAFPIPGAPPYVPRNADGSSHGKMPLRRALACSYNIPAVALLDRIGIDSALEMAHRLGINDLRGNYGLALTLGGGEIALLDHTYAFSVFANGGVMAGVPVPEHKREPGFRELDPVCVLRVTDVRGRVIDEYLQPTTKRLLSPQVTHLLTSVLSDNAARTPAFGAHNTLVLSRPAAAKTGTTNDFTDGWTMGYNPQVSIGVWVGNADRSPMNGMWGVTGASPIWRDLMEYCFQALPPADFVEPAGMVWAEVDPESGALPKGGNKARDIFVLGREPISGDKQRMQIPLCSASGKLATKHCPENEISVHEYDLFPTADGGWVRSMRGNQPPTLYCDQHDPNARPTPTVAPTDAPQ